MEFYFIENLFKLIVVIVVSLIQIDEILWNFEVINLKLDSFFWKKNDEDIFLEINIPRIRLEANVYNINSVFNDVDYNVEILSESNVDENLFFLAGHSGNGAANYFNDLFLLEVGDIIYVIKDNEKINFRVDEIFHIDKNGYFDVSYNVVSDTLFLITCSLNYPGMQMVVKSSLVEC